MKIVHIEYEHFTPLDPWNSFLVSVKNMLIPAKEVASDYDEHGPIFIIDRDDQRYLMFDKSNEQSVVSKSTPSRLIHEYTQAMMLVMLYNSHPKHVTLLGLGGGALAHCLYAYDSNITIQAVELRQTVVDLAYRYFQLPNTERLSVTTMDARNYLLQTPSKSTNIIFSDLFWSDSVDAVQLEVEFIHECHRILNDKGWLVLNFISGENCLLNQLRTLEKLFFVVKICDLPSGNLVVYAGKCPLRTSKNIRKYKAEMLGNQLNLPLIKFKMLLQ